LLDFRGRFLAFAGAATVVRQNARSFRRTIRDRVSRCYRASRAAQGRQPGVRCDTAQTLVPIAFHCRRDAPVQRVSLLRDRAIHCRGVASRLRSTVHVPLTAFHCFLGAFHCFLAAFHCQKGGVSLFFVNGK
jgi:hypothetical protein